MKVPYVSLENAEAVNRHFSEARPNQVMMAGIHFILGRYLKAETVYEAEAYEVVEDHIQAGGQFLFAHNHQEFFDPLVLASMVQREKVFRSMRANTAIMAKSPLFNHRLYGGIVARSGAIPFFRPQEVEDSDNPGQKALVDAERKAINDSQVTIMQALMNKGGMHGAVYPEGSRYADEVEREQVKRAESGLAVARDVTKVRLLYDGIGRVVTGLDRPENVRIVCIGTMYDTGRGPEHMRHPVSYVATPFEVPETIEEVVAMTQTTLQRAVTEADVLAKARKLAYEITPAV